MRINPTLEKGLSFVLCLPTKANSDPTKKSKYENGPRTIISKPANLYSANRLITRTIAMIENPIKNSVQEPMPQNESLIGFEEVEFTDISSRLNDNDDQP
ncbi:MAG: hypothetical protein O2955_15730 [Planctomycetota bacterium]|nr:hypothetical protein [Planctomycetota bacterium]MDA1213965.1 hypothetical protein [Planctomycetota bacterium]